MQERMARLASGKVYMVKKQTLTLALDVNIVFMSNDIDVCMLYSFQVLLC